MSCQHCIARKVEIERLESICDPLYAALGMDLALNTQEEVVEEAVKRLEEAPDA